MSKLDPAKLDATLESLAPLLFIVIGLGMIVTAAVGVLAGSVAIAFAALGTGLVFFGGLARLLEEPFESFYVAPHIDRLPHGHPLKTFVWFLALRARDVCAHSRPRTPAKAAYPRYQYGSQAVPSPSRSRPNGSSPTTRTSPV
jgi:hypothetical protein